MDESIVVVTQHSTFDRDLLAGMREIVKRTTTPYNRAVASLDWEKVAFGEHTPEECRQRWEEIQSRLRIHRTLPELLDDAQSSRWDMARLRKAQRVKMRAEGAPTKPLSAFWLFSQDMRPKVTKKNPGLQQPEMMALLAKRYAAASAAKRQAYKDRAATALAQYNDQMELFRRSHPELLVDEPPRRPRSALEHFVRKHPDLPRAEAVAAYNALSAGEKSRYIRKSQRGRERYAKEVEAYHELYPGWKAPATDTSVSKMQRKILEEAEGKVPKPPRAYHLFLKEMVPKVDRPPNQTMLQHCSELWRSADAATKQRFQALADQQKAEYKRYLESLPAEERELTQKKPRRKVSRPARITAKQLFLREKMPTVFDTLSEDEWRRVLVRKFGKLSQPDKDMYAQRAEQLNAAAAVQGPTAGHGTAASSGPAEVLLNGSESPRDVKPPLELLLNPLELSDVELEMELEEEEEERLQQTPPRQEVKHKKRRHKAKEAEAVDMVKVYGSPQLDSTALQHANGRGDSVESSASEDPPTPVESPASEAPPTPRSKKRALAAATSEDDSDGSKKKRRKPETEDEENEDPPCTPYEWFIQNFRGKSTDGLTPRKLKKKAKKAWNVLTDDERQHVERRFAREHSWPC